MTNPNAVPCPPSTAPSVVPYRRPFLSAGQVSMIDALNRNTLLGWLSRYDHHMEQIGIAPVAKGGSRFFTMEQVGLFAAVRSAVAIKQAESVFEVLPQIAAHAAQLYSSVTAEIRWEQYGQNQRPYLPFPERRSHLQGRLGFGQFTFSITDDPYRYGGEDLMDLHAYPLPVILLPLDATLCNAWKRATWVFHEFELDD